MVMQRVLSRAGYCQACGLKTGNYLAHDSGEYTVLVPPASLLHAYYHLCTETSTTAPPTLLRPNTPHPTPRDLHTVTALEDKIWSKQ
jgi:hypothetical protein